MNLYGESPGAELRYDSVTYIHSTELTPSGIHVSVNNCH